MTTAGPPNVEELAREVRIYVFQQAAATVRVPGPTVLERGEAAALVWSLLTMGYGFMTALVIGGVIGTSPFQPGGTPASFTAFLAAVVGILGAVVAAALTLMGARAALRGTCSD